MASTRSWGKHRSDQASNVADVWLQGPCIWVSVYDVRIRTLVSDNEPEESAILAVYMVFIASSDQRGIHKPSVDS